ncbi:hypothetical protein SAMN02745126_03795 [Enhydrobacter aerosaccus]|uniref:Lipoprotein n=1 Tax=Enhydrobacter aerosaccus TaxID=225324 RepID=A0A1T4RHJ0_9HYPH|nr:hypothetical protein [Enhydrobacter aerosaccus]SKA15403.1 hypothetical protein SAMN02745126_03795 [Enhydrobacter aerosaccus]
MISKVKQVAVLVAGGLALGACTLGGADTAAPAKKPPAPDYQAASTAPPPASKGLQAICYTDADLAIVRARMLQQELVVATLQCQNPNGTRAFDSLYGNFVNKFSADLSNNARSLTDVSRRKRFNVDVLVTEFSNRMAQRAPVDKEFCSRSLRALEWSLDPKVKTLSDAPPPYDLGPEMNIHPCPAK